MSMTVISTVPLPNLELIVWFEGGISRHYDVMEFGIAQHDMNETVTPLPGGTGICWENGTIVTADDLSKTGTKINFVDTEKRRLLSDLSKIRRAASFSQTRLGEAAGIRQSVISRIEGCEISPQVNTLLKLLAPLGKTLEIVDLNDPEWKAPSRE